jgi:hypothetical protein
MDARGGRGQPSPSARAWRQKFSRAPEKEWFGRAQVVLSSAAKLSTFYFHPGM